LALPPPPTPPTSPTSPEQSGASASAAADVPASGAASSAAAGVPTTAIADTATDDIASMLDALSARKASASVAKKSLGKHHAHTGSSASETPLGGDKPPGKAELAVKVVASETSKVVAKGKARAAGKASAKGKAAVKSKAAMSHGLVLGCPKCRHSKTGCAQCRSPDYTGKRYSL
jgi:hypothetical protein